MDSKKVRSIIIMSFIFILAPFIVAFSYLSTKYDIVIGAKSFAESEILAHIAKETINKHNPDIEIGIKAGLTSSQINLIINGAQIDGLAEYTGSMQSLYWINTPAPLVASEVARWNVKQWSENMDKNKNTSNLWYGTGRANETMPGIGFENSYGLVVNPTSSKFSQYNSAQTIFDLINIGGKFTTDSTFASADVGLASMYDRYMGNPDGTTDGPSGKARIEELGMEVLIVDSTTNRYDYVKNGVADIAIGFTTDAQLNDTANYALLDIDNVKSMFPTYDVGYLFRQKTIDKYSSIRSRHWNTNTSLAEILNSIRISSPDMIAMNYEVQVENTDPGKVAIDFLERKGYFQK